MSAALDLTAEQLRAVELATAPDAPAIACLTGGPGVGKTTTVRAILDRAQERQLRVLCAAPSGKAAARMEEATGRPASTIHRLIGLRPGAEESILMGTWRPDWSQPEPYARVRADLLVVDEASMIPSPLMAILRRAAAEGGARLLLVGDKDQLPPVGPGDPYACLIDSGACPTVRLTQVHRQAAQSGIVRAAHAILAGRVPEFAADFQLITCDALSDVPATVWELIVRERLNERTSQVISPQNPGAAGVQAINDFVERSCRPVSEDDPLHGNGWRVGSKVICTRNRYARPNTDEPDVFNGDLGFVVEARAGRGGGVAASVDFGDKVATFSGEGLRSLDPAWALTCHRMQGSQADDVIVVAHTGHSFMLSRSLLYVAITRAAKRVWVVGQVEALKRAAKKSGNTKRDTWLRQRFERNEPDRIVPGKTDGLS